MVRLIVIAFMSSILIEDSVCQIVFPQDPFERNNNFGSFVSPLNQFGQQGSGYPYNGNIFLQNHFNHQGHLVQSAKLSTPKPLPVATSPTPTRTTPRSLIGISPAGSTTPEGLRPFSIQANRIGEKISRKKCYEYASLAQKKLQFATLTLGSSSTQDVSLSQCDLTSGLIIGGLKASDKEFPHMAGIFYRSLSNELVFGCGGSLISERFVLTSAHCEKRDTLPASNVRLGILELTSPNGEDFSILEFIVHDKYDAESKQNDIAVVKLDHDACESLKFPRYIRPACWGSTFYAGTSSNDLMKVKLDILDNSQCVRVYGEDGFEIDERQLCAGDLSGGHDTCQGDSGGPLQVVLPGSKCLSHIIGVTSYGSVCGEKNLPSVYTRVSAYLDWIESKVWG